MKIIIIVGPPGCGKTFYANQQIIKTGGVLVDDLTSLIQLESAISQNPDCVYIIDLSLIFGDNRDALGEYLRSKHVVDVEWVYFENNIDKCYNNVEYRNDGRNVDATLRLAKQYYKVPTGQIAKKIWQPEFLPEKTN